MIAGLVLAAFAYVVIEAIYGSKRDSYILNSNPKGNFMIIDTEVRKKIKTSVEYEHLDLSELILKEISWVIIDPKGKERKFCYYSDLDGNENIEYIAKEFIQDISNCAYLVAHNVQFDLKIIKYFIFDKHLSTDIKLHTICTMELGIKYSYYLSKYKKKWPKLTELHASIFKEDIPEKHKADYDARICLKCFKYLYNEKTIKLTDIHLKEINI